MGLQKAERAPAWLRPAGHRGGELDEQVVHLAAWLHLRDHLAVVGGRAEELRVERDDGRELDLERLGELRRGDLRPLRHAGHVQDDLRLAVVRAGRSQHVDQVLGVAQRSELRRRDDHDVVRADQRAARPARPGMRNVEDDARRRRAQDVEKLVERRLGEIDRAVEHGRRGEQAQIVAAFREQAVDEIAVEPVRREDRLGDALRRILVEVEAGRSEGDVEIDDDRCRRELARDRPGEVVRDGRCADAALGADDRDGAADRLRARRVKQVRDRLDDVQGVDGRDQVVAHAAAREFAVEQHVVDVADDEHLRARVADLGQAVEVGEERLPVVLRFSRISTFGVGWSL